MSTSSAIPWVHPHATAASRVTRADLDHVAAAQTAATGVPHHVYRLAGFGNRPTMLQVYSEPMAAAMRANGLTLTREA